ncbi:MFS general substrate transporter [Punctularia strigosozonata HHB-11173 SS5]|uniref:MFS general substrate transporter n=1 Tax=Punctularia strigosozonata (strain HHB-11173) TaxID=741275 RepID=UPI0004416657|nr:MFS general substrate transporter [Punctularia strigosozonata HHB-11173 SS5]EIN08075.1 MFS general substrate transporter [Punctularia strigosozonata HHB-11173 SS5]
MASQQQTRGDNISRVSTARSEAIGEEAPPKTDIDSFTQESPPTQGAVDIPPNGGYGWLCCAATFWINAHTWGVNSAYGVFLAHYLSSNFFPGASTLDFAFVGGLSISQAMLISPLATITTRRFGTRTTLLVGVFFETLSLIGASFAKQIWQLFLSQGVCFGWGMGFLFVGSVGVVPQWFTTRRSFANGIAASGSGVGGLTYSLATNAMIQHIGLPWAFRVLGICAFTVNTICALLIKDRNKHVGASVRGFDVALFRRREFLALLAFGFLSMLGYIVLLFSLPNYASSIGLSAHQGSVVGALLNLGQAMGRPPIGYFSDSVGRINMAAIMTLLAGVFSLVVWTNAVDYGVTLFFALIGGTVAGTYWAIIAPVTAEVMGLVDLPASLSITWVVISVPTTFSEAIALQITQSNGGNYLGAQLFTGFMYVGAAAIMWWVRVWKLEELEREEREAAEGTKIEKTGSSGMTIERGETSYWRKWKMITKV